MLSRGVFVFRMVHYIVSFYGERRRIDLPLKNYSLFVGILLIGMVFTVVMSTISRTYSYENITKETSVSKFQKVEKIQLQTSIENNISDELAIKKEVVSEENYFIKKLFSIAVGRWIGFEGIASVVSYDNLDISLLKKGFFNIKELNEQEIYQTISLSGSSRDDEQFKFNTASFVFQNIYRLIAIISVH